MGDKKKENGKGFFEVLKSTPNNLEEANLKTKNTYILAGIIVLAISAVFAILHIVLGLIVAVVSLICVVFLYFGGLEKNKKTFCTECGAKIDYESGVSWKVIKTEEKKVKTDPNKQEKQLCLRNVATVEFTSVCGNCGNTKVFTSTFDTAVMYTDRTMEYYNLESSIENYFKA